MFVFVYHDRRNISRCHRVDHELRRVVVPQNDINTLAAQFSRNCLNTRTTHTDASTNRVDTLVVGFHRDFRTGTRIAGSGFNLDHFFANFWHFNAEQFDQHFRFRTGHEQLSATRFWTHGIEYAANTVTRTEVLTWQHIFTQNHCFSVVTQIQGDVVAVNFLHHARDDLTFMLAELVNDHSALSFTNFLYDNLFSSLGGDTVEGDRFDLIFNVIVDVQALIFVTCRFESDLFRWLGHFFHDNPTTESIEVAALAIDFYTNIDLLLVFFLGCRSQCTFQRFENLFTRQ